MIKSSAFQERVIRIGEDAFSGCSSLESVELPSSVISIEYRAIGFIQENREIKKNLEQDKAGRQNLRSNRGLGKKQK